MRRLLAWLPPLQPIYQAVFLFIMREKIAYLMGENAAETEELLNSIIETYRYGDDD